MSSPYGQRAGHTNNDQDAHGDGRCPTGGKRKGPEADIDEDHRMSIRLAAAKDFDVVLLSNCYRLQSKRANPFRGLHIYDVKLYLSDTSCLNGVKFPKHHLEDMTRGSVPSYLAQKIMSTMLERWRHKVEVANDRFIKYRETQRLITANFSLKPKRGAVDDESIEVPFRIGQRGQPALKFSIRLEETRKDIAELLSLVVDAGKPVAPRRVNEPAVANQVDETRHDSAEELRGYQSFQVETMAIEPTFSVAIESKTNGDPSNKSQSLIDYLRHNYGISNLDEPIDEKVVFNFERALKFREVEVSHLKIFGLPMRFLFRRIAGSAHKASPLYPKLSILDYFSLIGVELMYPNLPCVDLYLSHDKHSVPMELCRLVEGQCAPLADQGEERLDLLHEQLKLSPLDYFGQVERQLKQVVEQNEKTLGKMGIDIEPQRDQIKLIGRVLTPMWLRGGANKTVKPKSGKYDTSKVEFLEPVKLRKFCITWISDTVDTSRESSDLREEYLSKFYREYCRVGRSKGVQIDIYDYHSKIIVDADPVSLGTRLANHVEWLNKQQTDHAIVIAPNDADYIKLFVQFIELEYESDEEHTTPSTRLCCLKVRDVERIIRESEIGVDSLMQKLWIRYNVQLGGLSYVPEMSGPFKMPENDFMVMGFHRQEEFSPTDNKYIVAAVGSWSTTSGGYSHAVRIRVVEAQYDAETNNLALMAKEILDSYARCMDQRLPSKLLILSENCDIGPSELNKMKSGWRCKYKNIGQASPRVSLSEIRRNHNIRLRLSLPIEVEGGADYQMPPGTVVESSLFGTDSFAYSPPTPSDVGGMRRPVIVRRLVDDIPMTNENFQRLIVSLCYNSSRPAPVYLAEFAVRIGRMISGCFEPIDELNSFFDRVDENYLNALLYSHYVVH